LKAQKTKSKHGKYANTIEEFLKVEARVCKPNCPGISIGAAYSGFNRAIKNKYSDKVLLSRVDGEIYIEKL